MLRNIITSFAITAMSCSAYASVVYPSGTPVNPLGQNFVALAGYQDLVDGVKPNPNADGIYDQLTEVHLVPNQVSGEINEDTGEHYLSFFPFYDRLGHVDKLTIDINLVTSWSDNALSNIEALYPNAWQIPLTAKSSQFEGLTKREYNDLYTVDIINEEDTLRVPGLGEPLRITLSKEGLQQYTCALKMRDAVARKAELLGDTSYIPSTLSILFDGLSQEYDVVKQDPISKEWFKDSLKFTIPIRLGDNDEVSGVGLDEKIYKTITTYQPRCLLPLHQHQRHSTIYVPQIRYTAFERLIEEAIRLGLDFRVVFN